MNPEQNLSRNLRIFRKRAKLTQRELGMKIGYSEKSVSKWELGENMPPVSTLTVLAETLGTNVDALLGFSGQPSFYLGIDGGGTKTRFSIANADGAIIRSVTLGGTNPIDIGFDAARSVLAQGIRRVCDEIPVGRVSVFAGIAGGISGDNPKYLHDFFDLFGFSCYGIGSDIENAIAATLGDGDGICTIMGTGNVTFAIRDGVRTRHGGYGYLFDEGGSGYDIGASGIRAALAAEDGSGAPTPLLNACREKTGRRMVDSIGDLYKGGKALIASFAPLVTHAAREGDAVSLEILRESIHHYAKHLAAALRRFSPGDKVRVRIIGGLSAEADLLLPLLTEEIPDLLTLDLEFVKTAPIEGALRLARKQAQRNDTGVNCE